MIIGMEFASVKIVDDVDPLYSAFPCVSWAFNPFPLQR